MNKAREQKILEAIRTAGHQALLIMGSDNITYLTGCVLPFADHFPTRTAALLITLQAEQHILCPRDWEEALRDQGWTGEILCIDEFAASSRKTCGMKIAETIQQIGAAKQAIGLDLKRVSQDMFIALRELLPEVKWISFDAPLREMRISKERFEIDLLETAVLQADRSLIGALNHAEGATQSPGYTLTEFSERIRVHLVESGGSGVGHLAVNQGRNLNAYFIPPRDIFKLGRMVRMDVTTHQQGYWSNAGRMAVIGEPTQAQLQAYRQNLALQQEAIEQLKPGVKCRAVFEAVRMRADRDGIAFWREAGAGHGIGTSEREAPFLNARDKTVLAPGMVVVLDIYSAGPEDEWIHSKDTFEIVPDGPRRMSWHREWDRLYSVTGARALH